MEEEKGEFIKLSEKGFPTGVAMGWTYAYLFFPPKPWKKEIFWKDNKVIIIKKKNQPHIYTKMRPNLGFLKANVIETCFSHRDHVPWA